MFATIWTNHTLHGANIDFRDIDPKRPSFRIDTSGTKRFFTWATSQKMNKYYSKKWQVSQMKKNLGTNNKINGNSIIGASRSETNYFAKVTKSQVSQDFIILNRVISLRMLLLSTMSSKMRRTTLSMLLLNSNLSIMGTGKPWNTTQETLQPSRCCYSN